MSLIQIAFFDIDGTLVDIDTKRPSPHAVETLQRLREKGVRVCLATGRAPMEVPKFEGAYFDAYLTYNGSYCYTADGTPLFRNPLPNCDVHTLIRNAAALGRPVSLATRDRMASNGKDQDLIDYYAIAGKEVVVCDDFDAVAEQDVYQVMMGCREADYPAILKDTVNTKIAAWWDRAADIIPASAGKGAAIRHLLAHYGLTKEQAIAFGDGRNDIEMLEAVGTGVAMGNAREDVKAHANAVCGSVAEDGIYHYCLEHGLI